MRLLQLFLALALIGASVAFVADTMLKALGSDREFNGKDIFNRG